MANLCECAKDLQSTAEQSRESETGIDYFVLHRVLNAYNNIHHYSSFTVAKVIFFGFSLYACVCLPARSHSFSILFTLAHTKNCVLVIVVKQQANIYIQIQMCYTLDVFAPSIHLYLAISLPFTRCRCVSQLQI